MHIIIVDLLFIILRHLGLTYIGLIDIKRIHEI